MTQSESIFSMSKSLYLSVNLIIHSYTTSEFATMIITLFSHSESVTIDMII